MKTSIKPVFDFSDCDSSIVLQEGTVRISVKGKIYSGTGRVQLDFRPTPHIYYHADFTGIDAIVSMTILGDFGSVKFFEFDGKNIAGFLITMGGDQRKEELSLLWCPRSTPTHGIGNEISVANHMIFHLINFPEYLSAHNFVFEPSEEQRLRINFIDLNYDTWHIKISSLIETGDRVNRLKTQGGFALTHTASANRIDDCAFTAEQAENALFMLRSFLSFAKGCCCDPVCPVGFDSANIPVWSTWDAPSEQWISVRSWFGRHSPEQLESLFPLFASRWSNKQWKSALHEIVYWYVSSNSGKGIDAGIILTQAALERLSFEFSVQDRKLILTNGFTALWASDKFRLLFSSLSIPLEIPAECPELLKMAKKHSWADAPHALTEVRNSLVHPEHKKRGQFDEVMYEAWNLGLWYLEMSILAVCGYSGTYANRLKRGWEGQAEPVPWTKP